LKRVTAGLTRVTAGYGILALVGMLSLSHLATARPQAQSATATPATSVSGDVAQIEPGHLALHTAKGDVQVTLPEGVRLLRVPPGSKDLKTAVAIAVTDINPGDRAVVLGHPGADPQTIEATRVLVLTKSDLASLHDAEIHEWQTRGIEGIVKSVDADKLEISIAAPNHPPTPGNLTHPVTVTTTDKTVLLRYAPNSIQFADARPSSLAGIKVGDQLRALGTRSDDGSQYAADKVVFGTFHNIGARVISVDTQANTVTVKSLATNKPVVVHVNADCKMHQLPDFVAQMIARLNTRGSGGPQGGGGRPPGGSAGGAGGGPPQAGGIGGGGQGGGGGMRRGGGMSNLSQALERMPSITLSDLQRDEPIVIFSTEGTSPSEVTAIYILTGVEPILAAQPKGGGEMNLGTWNLSLGGASAADSGP
jgi:hypothetical protein